MAELSPEVQGLLGGRRKKTRGGVLRRGSTASPATAAAAITDAAPPPSGVAAPSPANTGEDILNLFFYFLMWVAQRVQGVPSDVPDQGKNFKGVLDGLRQLGQDAHSKIDAVAMQALGEAGKKANDATVKVLEAAVTAADATTTAAVASGNMATVRAVKLHTWLLTMALTGLPVATGIQWQDGKLAELVSLLKDATISLMNAGAPKIIPALKSYNVEVEHIFYILCLFAVSHVLLAVVFWMFDAARDKAQSTYLKFTGAPAAAAPAAAPMSELDAKNAILDDARNRADKMVKEIALFKDLLSVAGPTDKAGLEAGIKSLELALGKLVDEVDSKIPGPKRKSRWAALANGGRRRLTSRRRRRAAYLPRQTRRSSSGRRQGYSRRRRE